MYEKKKQGGKLEQKVKTTKQDVLTITTFFYFVCAKDAEIRLNTDHTKSTASEQWQLKGEIYDDGRFFFTSIFVSHLMNLCFDRYQMFITRFAWSKVIFE